MTETRSIVYGPEHYCVCGFVMAIKNIDLLDLGAVTCKGPSIRTSGYQRYLPWTIKGYSAYQFAFSALIMDFPGYFAIHCAENSIFLRII